jgi:hypothetical protein
MLGALIQLLWILLYIGAGVAVVFVIIWFLRDILGLPLPENAIRVIWGCFALLVIIWLLTWLGGAGFRMPTP